MARPQKDNVDYFSHDIQLRKDWKVEYLRDVYGNDGYTFFCVWLEILGQSDWLNFTLPDTHIQLAFFARKEFKLEPEKFTEILSVAIESGLLQRKENIIYCDKLTKRMMPVYMERMEKRGGEMKFILPETELIVPVTPKGKERKGKETKEEESKVFIAPTLEEAKKFFVEKKGLPELLANEIGEYVWNFYSKPECNWTVIRNKKEKPMEDWHKAFAGAMTWGSVKNIMNFYQQQKRYANQ